MQIAPRHNATYCATVQKLISTNMHQHRSRTLEHFAVRLLSKTQTVLLTWESHCRAAYSPHISKQVRYESKKVDFQNFRNSI